ncbi:MAG: hypothetical protein BJ554DRAFT_6017 [Olpidium bornovanus]|uniref:ubiquitinyl hydrolase 1 n=1 Tax=Olpidium bornovanus TaxID=278681 RepID=A0A8H7ZYL7_9FUNG|nr:MAG: hypothetical protein BJ554DRAFT_6017 [Olpidium bornovanus]
MDVDGAGKKNQQREFNEVNIEECFDLFTAQEMIPDWRCPNCQKKMVAVKWAFRSLPASNTTLTQRFATFPDVLVVHTRRFELESWVPKKLGQLELRERIPNGASLTHPLGRPDIPIAVTFGILDLEKYRSTGKLSSEQVLPEDDAVGAASGLAVDEVALEQLMAMGFPKVRCQRALLKTGNNGSEVAMNWLFEHMEDQDIDDPIDAGESTSAQVSEAEVSMLADMGFTPAQARKALRETVSDDGQEPKPVHTAADLIFRYVFGVVFAKNNDVERAVEWLFSHPEETGEEAAAVPVAKQNTADALKKGRFSLKAFVSHKGTSVHCGHYVAHIRNVGGAAGDNEWTMFNDEKVVAAPNPPVDQAYILIFERREE